MSVEPRSTATANKFNTGRQHGSGASHPWGFHELRQKAARGDRVARRGHAG